MAKLILSPLSNLNNQSSAVATINSNMEAISTALENTLSRDGTSPNQMQALLDMNGFSIINAVTTDDESSLVSRGDAEELFGEVFTANYEEIIQTIITNNTMGWSPVFAIVNDTQRRVLELVDWVGGENNKPTLLGYVGETGIVSDIAEATDIRGPQGPTGAGSGDMLAENNLSDLDNFRVARDNLGLATTTTDNALVRFDSTIGNTQNSEVTLDDNGVFTLPETTTPANPTTSQVKAFAKGDYLSTLNGSGLEIALTRPDVDYQVFTSNGTWTKPSGFSSTALCHIQVWGAGGGGGNNVSGGYGGGGGGGGYIEAIVQLSSLPSTVTITVGTSAGSANGGNSSFGSFVAYGGGGGSEPPSDSAGGNGGAGGGVISRGNGSVAGRGGGGTAGSPQTSSNAAEPGGDCLNIYGGGGGAGGARDNGISGADGGYALFGGGGGGSGGDNTNGSGGGSLFGGNGGGYNQNGSVPGGGGGGNGRPGGRGEVRVRVFG